MTLEAAMTQFFRRFWFEEDGQDIIEYSLLITFIAIACMWFVGAGRSSVQSIWTTANNSVAVANVAAGGD
jgi:Flp pilus assembly pilin Flp